MSLSMHWFTIALPLALLYALFVWWWGGRGTPMSPSEVEDFVQSFLRLPLTEHDREMLPQLRRLMETDDGNEFIMQNLVKYRKVALYPSGSSHGTPEVSGVTADRRYGKRVLWPLLRVGSLPLFIGKRTGFFLEPEGFDEWNMVAMVRYRSRRDFLRFAHAITRQDISIHKWAAIEKTHVFPVTAFVSVFSVRLLVALVLTTIGLGTHLLLA